MEMTTAEVAAAVGGEAWGPVIGVAGVAIDSRAVQAGQLFVPLVAARDGHEFIAAALEAGASAYLTSRAPQGGSAVVVPETSEALSRLAAHHRRLLDVPVVGVTGSVGKTTTKDLIAAAMAGQRRAYASPRSFNNSIGVPYTVLNAPQGTEVLVLEMGASAPGEIERLCALGAPTVGVVTRVAPAHTLGFGGVEGVARAKAELVAALPRDGTAVLNQDDERVVAMRTVTGAAVVTFGWSPEADVRVLAAEVGPDLKPRLRLATPWGPVEALVPARGAHQAYNAAAAVAVAGVLGLDLARVGEALQGAVISGGRMELRSGPGGLRVLDDSYNASPVAAIAALEALAQVPARRRVAVLGLMAELGDLSDAEHRRVAEAAADLGIEVLAVAAPAYGAPMVASIEEARERLGDLGDQDVVLVKGSREAGMERLAAALAPRPENPDDGLSGAGDHLRAQRPHW